MAPYIAAVLEVSNMLWILFSLLDSGLRRSWLAKHGMLLRGHTKPITKGVSDFLYVVPVGDDVMPSGLTSGSGWHG